MRIACFSLILIVYFSLTAAVNAQDHETQRLHLFNTKNERTIDAIFWENGEYNKKGLKRFNYFLRDWRNEHLQPIDPELLSLLYNIQQTLGKKYPQILDQPIHVISGHRSYETNRILQWSGRNVAQNSMHIYGQAIDFKIPGVPLTELRDTAKYFKAGGVGYYPGDGFVHIDTANVREWSN